jgi:hypothetical protein
VFFLQNVFYFYSNSAGAQLLRITDPNVYNAITASSHRKHKAVIASRENNGDQKQIVLGIRWIFTDLPLLL